MLLKLLRRAGIFLGHLLVALIGTAVLSTEIVKAHRPASVAGILWEEFIVSICCAGLIGFGMYRTWRSKTGAWVWTLPTAFFAFHAFSVLSLAHGQSVLAETRGVWSQIFGFNCIDQIAVTHCRDFFEFTVAFIRSVAYSLGSLVGIYFANPIPSPIGKVKVVI